MVKMQVAATDSAASDFDYHICVINDFGPRRFDYDWNVRRTVVIELVIDMGLISLTNFDIVFPLPSQRLHRLAGFAMGAVIRHIVCDWHLLMRHSRLNEIRALSSRHLL